MTSSWGLGVLRYSRRQLHFYVDGGQRDEYGRMDAGHRGRRFWYHADFNPGWQRSDRRDESMGYEHSCTSHLGYGHLFSVPLVENRLRNVPNGDCTLS